MPSGDGEGPRESLVSSPPQGEASLDRVRIDSTISVTDLLERRPPERPRKYNSSPATVITVCANVVGSSVLVFPFAFRNAGVYSFVLFPFQVALACFSILWLCRSVELTEGLLHIPSVGRHVPRRRKHHTHLSYKQLGVRTFGKPIGYAIEVLIALYTWSMCINIGVILHNLIDPVVTHFIHHPDEAAPALVSTHNATNATNLTMPAGLHNGTRPLITALYSSSSDLWQLVSARQLQSNTSADDGWGGGGDDIGPAAAESIWLQERFQFVVLGALVLCFAPFKSLRALRYTSFVSLALMLYLTVVVVLETRNYHAGDAGGGGGGVGQSGGWVFDGGFFSPGLSMDFCQGVGILSFCTTSHYNIPRYYNELADATPAKMFGLSIVSYALIFLIYFTVAIAAYLSFGPTILSNILLNYRGDDALMLTVRVALVVVLVCAYPLVHQATRAALESIFFHPKPWRRSPPRWRLMCESVVLIPLAFVVSYWLPDIGIGLGFSGAVGSTLLVFILPPLFYLTVAKRVRKQQQKQQQEQQQQEEQTEAAPAATDSRAVWLDEPPFEAPLQWITPPSAIGTIAPPPPAAAATNGHAHTLPASPAEFDSRPQDKKEGLRGVEKPKPLLPPPAPVAVKADLSAAFAVLEEKGGVLSPPLVPEPVFKSPYSELGVDGNQQHVRAHVLTRRSESCLSSSTLGGPTPRVCDVVQVRVHGPEGGDRKRVSFDTMEEGDEAAAETDGNGTTGGEGEGEAAGRVNGLSNAVGGRGRGRVGERDESDDDAYVASLLPSVCDEVICWVSVVAGCVFCVAGLMGSAHALHQAVRDR
ncbi:unnamed protein product [Vitrella brassicaformis CCMP3155]|uniref:Amino acid transporter transmembrane domain-containing protein n=3 Tax=Vitrella brassicaformis TaxID=1169539 RepID=A0A0G4EH29_VITBC|nr:unnamed protein product [Vitrella brassicaformis CCMP3155]|eukprot:CEL95271.1 unnamed protein product [Vitrella brassicaformis CCMP3155]